jgi:hypothetical protein
MVRDKFGAILRAGDVVQCSEISKGRGHLWGSIVVGKRYAVVRARGDSVWVLNENLSVASYSGNSFIKCDIEREVAMPKTANTKSIEVTTKSAPDDSKPTTVGSMVDHPPHYGGSSNTYEAIKVIEAWSLGFCLGNAVKYIARAGKKDPAKRLEDLKKAAWYLRREIEEGSG